MIMGNLMSGENSLIALGNRSSIQLSYGRLCIENYKQRDLMD